MKQHGSPHSSRRSSSTRLRPRSLHDSHGSEVQAVSPPRYPTCEEPPSHFPPSHGYGAYQPHQGHPEERPSAPLTPRTATGAFASFPGPSPVNSQQHDLYNMPLQSPSSRNYYAPSSYHPTQAVFQPGFSPRSQPVPMPSLRRDDRSGREWAGPPWRSSRPPPMPGSEPDIDDSGKTKTQPPPHPDR